MRLLTLLYASSLVSFSDPDDPREEKRVGAYTFLLDGSADDDVDGQDGLSLPSTMDMYNDDPDDAVLEGEEPAGSKAATRPAFLRTGIDTGSSTEDESGDDGPRDSRQSAAHPRRGRGGSAYGLGERGRGAPRGNVPRGGSARGRGRGGVGVGSVGGGDSGSGDSGRGRGGRGGAGRGGGRGRGARGRGGRGAHGRRDGAAKKQARAGM